MQNNRMREHKIEEYKAAQDMYKFFNLLKWQTGSVLIGAIALVTGFVFSGSNTRERFPFLFFFSLILMATWGIYGEYCTRYSRIKIDRLHKLEKQLNFRQHRDCPSTYLKASYAANFLACGTPILFLFLWLEYYGIIVVAVGIIVLLRLRWQAIKKKTNILDLIGKILKAFFAKVDRMLGNKEKAEC